MMANEKGLLKIAIPAMLESLFVVLITMADTWMVAPIGTEAIAAVAIANQPKLFLFIVFTALSTATTITVAQAKGRNDATQTNAVMFFSIKAAALWSVIMAVIVIATAYPIMKIVSNQSDTMDMSVTFLRIIMVGTIFQAVSYSMNAALRGVGKVKTTLISNLTMGLTDVLFNYLLIGGHLGFPAWGVAGAALATALSCAAGFIVSLCAVLKPNDYINLRYCFKEHLRVSKADASEMHKRIINVYCENILTRVGFLVSGIIVARLGSFETSIYSVGLQLLSTSFAFGDGLQVAVMVLVGQCVGSGDRDACRRYVRYAILTGLTVSVFAMAGCGLFGGAFFRSFNTGEDFIAEGKVVSQFIMVVIPFQIIRITRIGVMRGFGDTKTPAIIGAICVLALDPPVSYFLAIIMGMGQNGLWIGTVITQIIWFMLAEILSRKAMTRYCREV